MFVVVCCVVTLACFPLVAVTKVLDVLKQFL